ncbi:MAG: hypothetical protein H7A51_13680 [Akkermansiaceae bacterium]|nr:hypothetical protein [Akkermansiaceae bacterium]
MKWDPSEVFVNSIALTPVRVLAVWVAGSIGAFIPVFIGGGFEALELLAWQVLFFPFYLVIVAFFSGWWGLVAVPLIMVFAYKLIRFMTNDNTGSDLMVILSLSFFITIRVGYHSSAVITSILAVIILGVTYWLTRRDREIYPE